MVLMRIAYIKNSVESSMYVQHGLGILSAIGKQAGHQSIWINPSIGMGIVPDVQAVAITSCSDGFPLAVEWAGKYKSINPAIPVWLGGPHPSFVPDDCARIPAFDHIVSGEGEIVWQEFCAGKRDFPRVIRGPSPADLDAVPWADREQDCNFLFCGENIIPVLPSYAAPTHTIIAGRSCRYNCSFCKPGDDLIFGKVRRRRSVDNVLAEISTLPACNSVMIHDDCLLEEEDWCQEWCAKWDGRPFICQARSDLICRKESLVGYMVTKGLSAFLIGFESGNQRILNLLRKGTKVEHNQKAAAICHELGIVIFANIMLGIPTETKAEAEDTIRMILDHIKPAHVSPANYTPYPGNDLADMVNRNGWNTAQDNYNFKRYYGNRPLKEEALGYSYDWLDQRLRQAGII